MLALEHQSVFIYDYLIDAGADVNYRDGNNLSVLHYALNARGEEYAVKILQSGKLDRAVAQIVGTNG